MTAQLLLEARGLVVRPGMAALDLEIRSGQLVCVLGGDGAGLGKCLRVLGGVEAAEAGSLSLLGRPIEQWDWQALRRQVGLASPRAPLLSIISGLRNVMLPALYHRIAPEREVERRAQALLGEMAYDADYGLLPAYMHELQRRHLIVSRALILEPPLLLVDEPMRGLGCAANALLRDYFLQQVRQRVQGLVVAGNDALMAQVADRVLFVGDERIHVFDSWRVLLQSADEEVQRFLELERRPCTAFE